MTITELMNKRASTWDAMKKLLDERTDEKGLMTAEDAAQYDRMEQEYNDLTNQIERRKRADEIENQMKKPVRDTLTGRPGAPTNEGAGRASKAYNDAFMKWMHVRNDAVTPEIRNALQVGTDTEGGYLVPEEFEKRLIMALEEENIFRRLATVIKTSGERVIPLETARGEAAWVEEEALIPESDAAFGQIRIGAHKLATRIKISNELMQDSAFDMASYVAGNFGRRMGEKEEDAFFNGDGSGKPLGILAASGGAQVGVTAPADGITFDNVIELYHSLRQPYRRNAVFMISDATAMALRKVKDGNQQYIWQNAVTADRPDMLFGRPVYTSRFMPEPTSGKVAMLFGDMKYYWIADRTTRTFKRLNELYAETDQTGFIATQRVDGKLILPEAVKALKMG